LRPFNYFVFDGKSSLDFGVRISGDGVYDAPKRDYEIQSVPGRSGDLVFDNNRYENVSLTYPAGIVKNFRNNVAALRSFLLTRTGYKRLEDTYHPDEYRLALFEGPLDVKETGNIAGKFDITFNCKPQRYLKSGERTYTFTAAGEIRNRTLFPAKPLVRIYGNGTAGIGSKTIEVSGNSYPYVEVDCETMDAFYGANNCNSMISLTSGDFPELVPGDNGITLGKGITKIELIPRWWIV
jgi:phage-related protein